MTNLQRELLKIAQRPGVVGQWAKLLYDTWEGPFPEWIPDGLPPEWKKHLRKTAEEHIPIEELLGNHEFAQHMRNSLPINR